MIKDVIRLKWQWHALLPHAQIAATLQMSQGVVAKYIAPATAAGLAPNSTGFAHTSTCATC